MSTAIAKQLSEACSTGDLDGLFQVIYCNPDIAWELICRPRDDTLETESPKHFLHIAAENGHQEIVRELVEFGADVNEVSNDNITPLTAACMNGHEEVAKLLVSKGAFVHSPKLGKASPILVACSSGKHRVVAFLLSEEPHVLQSLGKLLLYEACKLGHLSVIKVLLKRGVDVNPAPFNTMTEFLSHDIQGTPLYGACLGQQVAVVNYLMENGAVVTEEIIELFWEIIGEALMRYTKEARNKRKTSLSYEVDPSVTMFSAAWDRKNLHGVHKAWLVNLSARLVCMDLSGNQIEELPDELLNTLPALEVLDISNNKLEFLPEVASSFMRLQKLLASENDLRYVPASLFQVRTLKKVSLAHNKITSLCGDPVELENADVEGETWSCSALKVLTLSYNALQYLPRGIQGASALTKLYIDHNSLKDFPMPWKCPLEVIDASHNRLTHFSSNVEMVWAACLKRLNLSNNNLQAISWNICQLSGLQDLDLSHNTIKRLPRVEYWTCNTLHKLNLSYNKLSAKSMGDVHSGSSKRFPFFKSPNQEDTQELKTDAELPVALFSHTLETLLLNDNCLQMVPLSVCGLTSLIELDLSNNPDLRNLPPELGNLRECWQLRLNKLNLMEIPKHVRPGENGVRPKDTLAYLRATLRKSVPYYRMKLMVVGLQGRGKTTLLAALKGQKLPPNLSTVGIVIDEWQIQISSSSRFTLQRLLQIQTDSPTITFSTWDLAGQSVYYAAHQMFLSPNTLYLAVWNVTHGEDGVQSLRKWLLNIQARAPFSNVVVVGTHLDLLPKKNRQARADALRHSIAKKYHDIQGFPKMVGNIMVSALTGENMQDLKELIYSKALRAKDSGENIIGRWVPQSYIDLEQAIFREAERRRTTGEPPVLLEEEVLQLAKSSPQNDILGSEELALATRFLHENGILLHYNDQLRGLNHLYFIDPTWVCDLIATIVTVRERNPFIVDGVMKKKDLELVLRDPKFPLDYIPQYLQLMERFEIALAFNEEHLLIPSMLPHEKPGIQLHRIRKLISRVKLSEVKRKTPVEEKRERGLGTFTRVHEEGSFNTVRRNYEMAYIPSGFWSRLITRLMVSVQRWSTNEGILDDSYSLVYWRQGIGVVYESGHFLVESYENVSPLIQGKAMFEDVNGIAVEVWSEQRDFAAVGFIVDQIDALISEWYPGLDETDMYGFPLVQRLIPCPRCCLVMSQRGRSMKRWVSMEIPTSGSTSDLQPQRSRVHNFTLRTCAAMALSFSTIACPNHPDKFVSLQQLIPDLLLADLPRGLLVDENQFKFEARESQKIGGGGAGEVFLGTYRNDSVAVKTFHSSKNSGHLNDSGLGETGPQAGSRTLGGSFYRRSRSEDSATRRTDAFSSPYEEEDVEAELEKTKVVKAFWDLRQEVAVLCRLNHPCVVSLLGVSLRPLCFILELAPHGSLASVLEELLSSRESDTQSEGVTSSREPILGRRLSYKISFQIASAIWYLHDCDIIYRDLKADNVLVWSLEESDLINVKVSDYGISCFATPQGVAGEEGTPGYQAPEIRTGVGYDEKVDIFSFAIFIFELLSGCRPFRDYRNQLDIKKAIRRGVRPSLEAHDIDTQLPRLELLMRLCWNQLPERRPSAGCILQQMQEPAFLCQCRLMPPLNEGLLEKITAIHNLSQAGPDGRLSESTPSFALLWSRERESRSYSMINCETGLFYAHDESCPGHRVLCMTKVDNRTWLGTEGCTIEVFGRRSWRLPTTLWYYVTKAPVLALLTQTVPSVSSASGASEQECGSSVKSVYASLANGTLIVLSQQTGKPEIRCHFDVTPVLEGQDELLKGEAAKWSAIELVNLGQGGMPAKSMVLVLDNKELWVGCGNKIVVVDTSTLVILDDIAVYKTRRTHVRIMVTDGSRVWSADRRSAKILQWNVATRQLTHIFDCDVENPVGEVVCERVKEVRRMRTITGGADDYESSYTESMLKEAMAVEKRREGSGDSLPGDSDGKEEEGMTSADNESFSSAKRTLPVSIQRSEARSSDKETIDKDVQRRRRSLSSETNDSGVSLEASLCRTVTHQSVAAVEGATAYPEATTPMLNEDPRSLHESGVVVPSEERASAIDKATVLSEAGQSRTERATFIVGCTSDDHVDGETSPLARMDDCEESTMKQISADDGVVNEVEERDEDRVIKINPREFEFVDREETRQAFIEGRTKTARTGSEKRRELASMRSLQTSFKPTLRTPSLMSSKKRRSQRKQPSTDTHPSPKPWAGRPRLKVLTGSINRVTALLLVEDTLWIGRGVGDVITVNVNAERKDVSLGHVFAKLESDNLLGYENGQVDEIVQTGSQKIVCLRRLELSRRSSSDEMKPASKAGPTTSHNIEDRFTERYQLTVWEAWGSPEFTSFQNQLDQFDSLVD